LNFVRFLNLFVITIQRYLFIMQLLKPKKIDLLDEALDDRSDQEDSFGRLIFLGAIALGGMAVFTALNSILLGVLLFKPPPSLVRDTQTGEAYRVKPKDATERENSEIMAFVVDRVHRLFTWTGTIPNKQHPGLLEQDPGIVVTGKSRSLKIPTSSYEASFSLTEAIRASVIEKMATQVPQDIFHNDPQNMTRNKYVLLKERFWSTPQKIAKGRWQVNLVADITLFNPETPQGRAIGRFNKRIFISTTPEVPLLAKENPFQFLTVSNRKEGLVIDSLVEFERGATPNVPR
jgi:hypothetical protein